MTRAGATWPATLADVAEQCGLPLRVRVCALATADHAEDPRVFAHTHHARGRWSVCVCRAIYSLSPAAQAGVLWHEIGHLLDGTASPAAERPTATERRAVDRIYHDRPATERAEEAKANARIRSIFGVKIHYNRDHIQEVW
jgi:hypothetical protein